MKPSLTLLTALLLAPLAALHAAEPQLKVGDPAPPLNVAQWLRGTPVRAFEKGHAYLIDFWATWCGPCVASMPHIEHLHQRYKDQGLVVIGQDVWEEDAGKVKPLVEKIGDKMTFRIALDDDKGTMGKTWLKAAGVDGIPTAFLVGKDGKIAWVGHPMALEEGVIEQVLAGTYDLSKAAMDFQHEKVAEKRSAHFYQLIRAKKWAEAETVLNEIVTLTGAKEEEVAVARLMVLTGRGDFDAAGDLAERYSQHEKVKDNADALNQIAHQLLENERVKGSALTLAGKLAARADELRDGNDANILNTHARALFMKGDRVKAVELQQKAVGLTQDPKEKEQLQSTLHSYQAGQLQNPK